MSTQQDASVISLALGLAPDEHPIFIDASALKKADCQRKYAYSVGRGYRLKSVNPIFARGKAIHKYAELIERGEPELAALAQALAIEGLKDKTEIMNVCSQYGRMNMTKPARDGERLLVEHQFLVRYRERVCKGRKIVVFLTGRIDRINFTSQGLLEVIDYKSSSSWDKDKIFDSYLHDVQLDFYPWILSKFAYEIFTDISLANAAWYGKLGTRVVAVMLAGKPLPRWEIGRFITSTPEEREDFGQELSVKVDELIGLHCDMMDSDDLPARTGRMANACPRCDMRDLCYAKDALEESSFMRNVEIKTWDPRLW